MMESSSKSYRLSAPGISPVAPSGLIVRMPSIGGAENAAYNRTLLTCQTGPRIWPSRTTHANADSYPSRWVVSSVNKGIRDAAERY